MAKGVYAALSGAVAADVALDTTAQNLANTTTRGYQRLRPLFQKALAQQGANANAPGQNRFAAPAGTVIDLTPGVIKSTGRPLDVALPEGAFLAVSTPRGERYTRAGDIEVRPDGSMRVAGQEIMAESGEPVRVDPTLTTTIDKEGQVLSGGQPVARFKLVGFAQARFLQPEGGALLAATQASGAPAAASGEVRVGELEEPNATPVTAMTELMTTTRLFDAYQRAIDTFREADRRIASMPSS